MLLSISELNTWNSLGNLCDFTLDDGLKVTAFVEGLIYVAGYRLICISDLI